MKAAPHINYKALYKQSLQHGRQQGKVIALLQDDVSKCIKEQLRFSYLIHFIKSNRNNAASQNIFESELAKLPKSLSSISLK